MKTHWSVPAVALVLVLAVGSAKADSCPEMISAECGGGSAWFGLRGDGSNIAQGQTVLLPCRARLLSVEFQLINNGSPNQGVPPMIQGDPVSVAVMDLYQNHYATAQATMPFNQGTGWLAFDFRNQNIVLAPGRYLIVAYTDVPRQCGFAFCPDQNPYPDGERYASDNGLEGPWQPWYGITDVPFRVYLEVGGPISIDIKPGSCPNALNVKPFEKLSKKDNEKQGGALPVAVLGAEDFNVNDIDVSSLRLNGVAPLRHDYEDVSTPLEDREGCECSTSGPDGRAELTLKFQKSEVVATLGRVTKGDVIPLTLTGQLSDGTPFDASDCVTIVNGELEGVDSFSGDDVVLRPAVPNPFNPTTRISYFLLRDDYVRLTVYDVAGGLVERVVEETQSGGEHVVEWNAQQLASGVYFYRLEVGDFQETRKLILLK